MRASTPELRDLLASKQAMIADLFTIALLDGTVLTLTSAPDFDVHWRGNAYTRTYTMERGDIVSSVGVEVDEIELTLTVKPEDVLHGMSVPAFIHNGGFDGARVLIERAFMAVQGVPVGVIHLFEGSVQQPAPARTRITLTVSSDLIWLNQMVPRNTITPGCGNILFDGRCGLSRAPYTHAGTVQAGSSKNSLVTTLPQADGYYTLGSVTMTSGNNAGAQRSVKLHNQDRLVPSYPFYYPVMAGDTFTATAGCDKTRAMCSSAKFNNAAHMRLFPFVPTPVASA